MGNLIHRGKGSFTHVENTIFFDHSLSLKAKGIYCQIRSLETNPEWVFTIAGFASLVKDGKDSVTAGIKELEKAGYIIRARMRSENGRFLKAEESTWITLDDPVMYDQVAEELKTDGFAILSELYAEKSKPAKLSEKTAESDENSQVAARIGFSASGKSTSGKSRAINPLSDKQLNESTNPSLSPQADPSCGKPSDKPEGKRSDFVEFEKGEFSLEFEELCKLSLKPVVSIKFKRDCNDAFKKRVEEGYHPTQILEAYRAYETDFWNRNGDDTQLAKNLVRWLIAEDGLEAYADEPIPPTLRGNNDEPLSMEELAEVDKNYAVIMRKIQSRRGVLRSYVEYEMRGEFTEEDVQARFESDRALQDYIVAAKRHYDRYVELCALFKQMHEEWKRGDSASGGSG